MPKKVNEVFLIVRLGEVDGEHKVLEVHATEASANMAVDKFSDGEENDDMDILAFEVQNNIESSKPKSSKAASKPKAKAKKSPTPKDEDIDEQDIDGSATEDAPQAKAAASKKAKPDDVRKKIPEGKSDSLNGLKLLFTGTFSIDRKTCEATAVKYGATIASKLADTDYVVLGVRPGAKKVDEIEAKGLATIDEDQFNEMLKTGVAGDVGAVADAAPQKKKQKK